MTLLGFWRSRDSARSVRQWAARLQRSPTNQPIRLGKNPKDIVQAK